MPPNTVAGYQLVRQILPSKFEYDLLEANSSYRKVCENEPFFLGDRPFDVRRGIISKDSLAKLTELLNDPNPRCLKLVGYFQQAIFCDEDMKSLWSLKNVANHSSAVHISEFEVLKHYVHSAHAHGGAGGRHAAGGGGGGIHHKVNTDLTLPAHASSTAEHRHHEPPRVNTDLTHPAGPDTTASAPAPPPPAAAVTKTPAAVEAAAVPAAVRPKTDLTYPDPPAPTPGHSRAHRILRHLNISLEVPGDSSTALNYTQILDLAGPGGVSISIPELISLQTMPTAEDICVYLRCLPSHYHFNSVQFYEMILNRTRYRDIWVFEAPPCGGPRGRVWEVLDFFYKRRGAKRYDERVCVCVCV